MRHPAHRALSINGVGNVSHVGGGLQMQTDLAIGSAQLRGA